MTAEPCASSSLGDQSPSDNEGGEPFPQSSPLQILSGFKTLYQTLNRDFLAQKRAKEKLSEVYAAHIQFEDSFHRIDGINHLYHYFQSLYENVESISFDFHDDWVSDQGGVVSWTMTFVHPKLNAGQPISVEGMSKLTIEKNLIVHHQDYFDGGALLYEHVPLMGSVVKYLKKRMAS